MANSSLLKSALHNSIAEGLYNEIQNRNSRYYYFLGKTLAWEDELEPPYPFDSYDYELKTRNEIITMKEIKSTDIAFVVERRNWEGGVVYDMYDDKYSDVVDGINLISGGYGFADPPTVTISGGGGAGATAVATIANGVVIDITLTNAGRGYTSAPNVEITGGGGEGVVAEAVIPISANGFQRMEETYFYVITDEFNVYKCLDNNRGAQSTYKPVGTTVDPVIMPDGYMWKYMYSIPIALRNKFLTDQYMPVVTALKGQFYSNGQIQNVKIQNPGKDYTFASISVSGDGSRPEDPIFITSANISTTGADYTSGATVEIDPPFSSVPWQADQAFFLGQKVSHNNNIYEVAGPGVTAAPAPSHRYGIVANGTVALKYIGTTASGVANVVGGEVTSIDLLGGVREINLTRGGSGYTSAPSISFSGDGTGAAAMAVMHDGTLHHIEILDSGDNYTSAPEVIIGTPWEAETEYTLLQQVFVSNRLYTVTVAGTTGTTAPTHTSGAETDGTAELTYAGISAAGVSVLRYGAGYSTIPAVTISPVSAGDGASAYLSSVKSEAKLLPIINDGQITGVQIDNGGAGYTYANLSVAGDGTSAELSADLSPGDVSTLQANTELLTIDGRIMAIKVVSGGFGWASATVTIEGDGVGATAEAVMSLGAIKSIRMTNYGSGYRWARVVITGNGYGAKARAIISTYGGHGKDSVNGLFSRTLMFYTNISKDKNQGFDVNNDFRQIGIIKNPRQYGYTYTLESSLASACFVITGAINVNNFEQDMLIRISSSGARFRIVNLTSSAMLVQSLDNAVPVIGNIMTNDFSQTFGVTGVVAPTVDKYSGDLLFIDNKQAFTPTGDQTVTLRTVIKF